MGRNQASRRRFAMLPALFVGIAAAAPAFAGETSQELWPEIDLWVRFSPEWRLSCFWAVASNVETEYREGTVILQADYAFGKPGRLYRGRLLDEGRAAEMKSNLVRLGFLGGESLGDDGAEYEEKAALLEWHLRVPLANRILLSHRSRVDLRWLGDDVEFSTRWRYRVMLEREFDRGRYSFVPYGNAEAYYDSRYDTVNRVRVVAGTSLAWSPRFAFEGNLTYQHDSKSSVTDLLALNAIFHAYFDAGRGG